MSHGKPTGAAHPAAEADEREDAKAPPEAARVTDAFKDHPAAGDTTPAVESQGGAGSPAGDASGSPQPLIPANGKDQKAARTLQDRIDDSIGAAGAGPAA